MTDETESKVRQWATKRNGEELTMRDVVELVLAVDDDAVARHEETVNRFQNHVAEATLRDERIAVLEAWRRETVSTCVEKIRALIRSEHTDRHSQHMRDDHAPPPMKPDTLAGVTVGPDEEMGDIKRAWRVARWFVAALVLFLTAALAEQVMHSWFGIP